MVVISIKLIGTQTKGTNDMFSNTAKTTKSANKLKAIGTAVGIAVLLGACSAQTTAAPQRPVATQVTNPVATTTPPVETVVVPKTEAPTTVAPKPAAPDYTVGACAPENMSDGFDYQVVNIKDTDPDGGLVLRVAPSYNQPRITTISEYSIVDSYGTSDSCSIDSKGRTWWYVDAPGIASGWVNAYYLQVTYLDDTFFDGDFESAVDHHDVDNQHLDGELTDAELFEEMQYACLNGVTDCSEFYAIFGTGD